MTIKKFTFNEFQENTYVIYDQTKECIIIDPGCNNKKEEEKLLNFIKNKKLKPKKLINTHCHIDHVFGNNFINKIFELELHIHEKEKENLDLAKKYSEMYGIEYTPYTQKLNFIKENEKIYFGNNVLEIIFTPGHSPGHISFVSNKKKIIISGDVLFKESIGRTDLPGGNYETLIQSIKTKILNYPEEYTIFPGHGPETQISYEKKYNPFLN